MRACPSWNYGLQGGNARASVLMPARWLTASRSAPSLGALDEAACQAVAAVLRQHERSPNLAQTAPLDIEHGGDGDDALATNPTDIAQQRQRPRRDSICWCDKPKTEFTYVIQFR